MLSRRHFLGAIGYPAAAAVAASALRPRASADAIAMLRGLASETGTPESIAREERFWFEVQQAFAVDRSLVNLNNGGVSPAPEIVQDAVKRHLDFSNNAPPYTMWDILEPQKESVRTRLAGIFGCEAEEIAITRNASEGLHICQLGLDVEPGDELLTTTQDYPRMVQAWQQRERREGVVFKQFSIPVPAEDSDEIESLFEQQITSRTRVILMCHVINLTGQILPVAKIVRMARRRGIPVIVDGAHSFAHFEFTHADLDCDYFATSLHKWMFAPIGTGMLFVRRDKIRDLWALMPPPEGKDDDIRKFEEIGTHPAAATLAVAEALTFHEGIGAARKEARLRYLRDSWARRLLSHDRVRLHTSLKPEFSCGIATFQVEGIDSGDLRDHLWKTHRILTVSIKHDEFEGIRVSPSVYTTMEELERFCEAVETVIKEGLPTT